jgi:hypothetical protein
MFSLIKKHSLKTSAVMALAIAGSGFGLEAVKANEISADLTLGQIQEYDQEAPMAQVTSVSQLKDVSPTDWAYEALRSLVERYGCIVGYPDSTFRGNRALSRYEFAAGLNACMQQMERLIAASEAVLKEDIAKLQRLMSEFEAELAALGARVDNLEGRVAFLEDHQFSTTTKLKGEVILALTASDGGENQFDEDADAQVTLSNRVRLQLDSSFTGKDLLRVRLNTGNGPELENEFGTYSARLNFNQSLDNDIEIDKLYYKTKVGEQTTFIVGSLFQPQDLLDTYTPFTSSSGTGSISRMARFNPFIYRQISTGAGAGVKYEFNDTFDISAAYIAGEADDPSDGNGLFNGDYTAIAQLGIHPTDKIDIGLAYVHFYGDTGNISGDTSGCPSDSVITCASGRDAERPFGGEATSSDNVGIQATWRISEKFNLAGWFGYAWAQSEVSDDDAELLNWSVNASVLDLGKEGAVGTIAFGQAPYVVNHSDSDVEADNANWYVEAQYKYPVHKNISITPGIYAIFNPEDESDNDTVVVGVIRTVFQF